MQRWLIGVAVIAGVAVVAIALAMHPRTGGEAMREANRISLHPERKPKAGVESGAPASPLFTDADLEARLRALRGRPVVLNAWASWCPPCREELPLLASAAARFGRRVVFLGADVEDDATGARQLLAEVPLGYPSYATSLEGLRSLSPVTGTPFTLFIDRRGEVVGQQIGAYHSQEELDADVAALVGHT
ncbi:MAG: TlpA family protein disulfide reductase [Solirubrobacterales bacterium]